MQAITIPSSSSNTTTTTTTNSNVSTGASWTNQPNNQLSCGMVAAADEGESTPSPCCTWPGKLWGGDGSEFWRMWTQQTSNLTSSSAGSTCSSSGYGSTKTGGRGRVSTSSIESGSSIESWSSLESGSSYEDISISDVDDNNNNNGTTTTNTSTITTNILGHHHNLEDLKKWTTTSVISDNNNNNNSSISSPTTVKCGKEDPITSPTTDEDSDNNNNNNNKEENVNNSSDGGASKEKKKASRTRLLDDDGFIRRAACVCVDETESKVLLMSGKKDRGSWLVPGGGVEPGEEDPAAALREAWEEAGVQGHLTRYLGLFETQHHSGRKRHRTAVYVVSVNQILAQYPEAHLGRLREWFSLEEALLHLTRNRPVQSAYLQMMLVSRLKVPAPT